jgi:hypothetical protein
MSIAQENLISERVARIERLLAAQRVRVHRLEAQGLDISKPLALLKLMEAIAHQFRKAWKLMHAQQVRQARLSRTPGGVRSPPHGLPTRKRGPSATKPRREVATFACPHCGLVLGVSNGALVYDVGQWARRCSHQMLQTPALCQLLPGAAASMH